MATEHAKKHKGSSGGNRLFGREVVTIRYGLYRVHRLIRSGGIDKRALSSHAAGKIVTNRLTRK
jgi:hypothetical protein